MPDKLFRRGAGHFRPQAADAGGVFGDEGAKDLDAFISDVLAELEGKVRREEMADDDKQ